MLYEFKSKATGTVVMTVPIAERLLAIVGKAPGPKGIFTVDQMPSALSALQAAIDQEAADLAAASSASSASSASGDNGHTPRNASTEPVDPHHPVPVSLRQRAWPLMDMLRTAHAKGKDVTWGV